MFWTYSQCLAKPVRDFSSKLPWIIMQSKLKLWTRILWCNALYAKICVLLWKSWHLDDSTQKRIISIFMTNTTLSKRFQCQQLFLFKEYPLLIFLNNYFLSICSIGTFLFQFWKSVCAHFVSLLMNKLNDSTCFCIFGPLLFFSLPVTDISSSQF